MSTVFLDCVRCIPTHTPVVMHRAVLRTPRGRFRKSCCACSSGGCGRKPTRRARYRYAWSCGHLLSLLVFEDIGYEFGTVWFVVAAVILPPQLHTFCMGNQSHYLALRHPSKRL